MASQRTVVDEGLQKKRLRTARTRLGFGQLADEQIARSDARSTFFLILNEIAPQICESLEKNVFPDFRIFFTEACAQAADIPDDPVLQFLICLQRNGHLRDGGEFSYAVLRQFASGMPSARRTLVSLSAWAEQYRLCADWCLDIALYTLYQWQAATVNGSGAAVGMWFYPPLSLQPRADHPGFVFQVGGLAFPPSPHGQLRRSSTAAYEPLFETRAAAQQRILETFEEQLARYLDEVEQLAASPRASTHGLRQFAWLARYQCLNEDFAEISRQEQLHAESVAEPARQLAKLIGLDLRKPNRGRPPGSKDSHVRWRRG